MAEVISLDSENFEENVLNGEGRKVVEFFANWCPDCRAVEPVFKEIARTTEDGTAFYRLDIQENPEKAQQFEVKHIPHFMVFENGKKTREGTEVIRKKELISLILGNKD